MSGATITAGRLDLMLTQTDPHFENWDQDATAVAERYDLADPAVVEDLIKGRKIG